MEDNKALKSILKEWFFLKSGCHISDKTIHKVYLDIVNSEVK